MKKAISTFLLLLPSCLYAATFLVTTNGTSGPGSIYEAFAAAAQNGTTTTDTIAFNLPLDQTTITINNSLIATSNLVIDGSTQPSKPFGTSEARVQIKALGCISGLYINGAQHIEVYGLWFSDFTAGSLSCFASAISIRNTGYFTLGKPGKGNCFSNNRTSIVNPWQLSGDSTENTNIKIQANRFGMDTSNVPDYSSSNLAFGATRNLLFGGDAVNEGNRIGNAFVNVGNWYIPLSAAGDSIVFKNNFFGFDAYNGPLLSTIGFYIGGYMGTKSLLNIVIENNSIGKDDATNKIWITDIKGNITIRNNYIGSLNTAITPGEIASAIYLGNCEKKDSISIQNNTINGYTNGVLISGTKDVTISNNSFYCNRKGISYSRPDGVPVVSFDELNANYLKGNTVPFSTIEIFSTLVCTEFCENGKTFLATVAADANGNFNYSGALSGKISATATTPSGTTGEFYGPKFSMQNIEQRDATCGFKNGYIKGIKIIKGNTFYWEDEAGNIVGRDTSVYNLGAGKYRFYVKDSLSSCPVYSTYIILKGLLKPSVDSTFSVVNTSCGKSLGQVILNGKTSAETIPHWLDSTGKLLQNYGDRITDLPAGNYYYKLFLWQDTACYTNFGPFTILDKVGPSLVTNNVLIKPSNCGEANGSITNITYQNDSGTSGFRWEDSTGALIATTLDLKNVQGGKYRLKYKDASLCDTIVSAFFIIDVTGGIQIDTSQRIIKATSCTGTTGSITNLKIPSANYFEWINVTTNQKVGTQLDLGQVPSGYYRMNTGNAIGCKDTSTVMFIPPGTFAPIVVQNKQQVQPNCGLPNGSLKITSFSTDSTRYTFTWKDSISGASLSNSSLLANVNSGTYILSAVDTNGCTAKLLTTIMAQVGKPVFDLSQVKLQHDTCNQLNGRIENVIINGGQKPYLWQWYKNGTNTPYSNNVSSTVNLKQGNYTIKVSDTYGCETTSNSITIADYDKQLPAPIADNLIIQRNTSSQIIIKNFTPGTYSLFDTITASLPYRISNGTRLATPVVSYNKTFYIQYNLGNCVSTLLPVLVSVFDQTKLSLPNAFSPNGDGINDVWKIQVQGLITVKELLVFNRYGQLIFSTKDSGAGWDGKVKNAFVPVGTYYWIVTATDNNGKEIKQQGSVIVLR